MAAEVDNGVLEVRIPKPEERRPRRVQIGGGKTDAGGNGSTPALEGTATDRAA